MKCLAPVPYSLSSKRYYTYQGHNLAQLLRARLLILAHRRGAGRNRVGAVFRPINSADHQNDLSRPIQNPALARGFRVREHAPAAVVAHGVDHLVLDLWRRVAV